MQVWLNSFCNPYKSEDAKKTKKNKKELERIADRNSKRDKHLNFFREHLSLGFSQMFLPLWCNLIVIYFCTCRFNGPHGDPFHGMLQAMKHLEQLGAAGEWPVCVHRCCWWALSCVGRNKQVAKTPGDSLYFPCGIYDYIITKGSSTFARLNQTTEMWASTPLVSS